jgi:SAM-dependent methyltransferase
MDWSEKARLWVEAESEIEAIHSPVAVELLRRSAIRRGQTVFDIGCGSGGTVLTIADLVGPEGRVTGFDIAPPMISRAGERTAQLAQVSLLTADVEQHEFEHGVADLVFSMFGMMFYQNPAAAFANFQQATRPGGQMHFAAWAGGKDNPWFAYPRRAAEIHLGGLPQMPATAPGPLAFADTDRISNLLGDAGWQDVSVEAVDLYLTPRASPAEVAQMLIGIGPTSDLIAARTDDVSRHAELTEAVLAEIAASLASHVGPEGLRVPAKVNFFSARCPV